MRELQLRIGMAHQVFDIRPFQVFSVFRITSASQNLSVSQGNDFCKIRPKPISRGIAKHRNTLEWPYEPNVLIQL